MTGASSSRRALVIGLSVVGALAFGLRAFPFVTGPDGAWSSPVDYDEGVYFSAAAWLSEGTWPWRDFVFVHPPGQLLFLLVSSVWTKSLLGLSGAFALSRWLAALLGTLSTVLVGVTLSRVPRAPLGAVLLGAMLYATYPEAAQVERGPFLEPLLNAVCLGGVLALSSSRRFAAPLAGALFGFAVAIKLLAAVWLLAVPFALWSRPRREWLLFALAALISGALAFLPALSALDAFWSQGVLFHLHRPPDGLIERAPRLLQLVNKLHLVSPLLAAGGLLLAWRRDEPLLRGVAVAWALVVAWLFASAAYWNQYNAHLAAPEALLAGGALVLLPPRARALAMLAALISAAVSAGHLVRRTRTSNEHFAVARSPLATSPDCVFAFEPAWLLAANRLPPKETGPLVDNYAVMLLDVQRDGARFPSSSAAFASAARLPPGLRECRYLFAGERAERQAGLEVLALTHEQSADVALVWERRLPRKE